MLISTILLILLSLLLKAPRQFIYHIFDLVVVHIRRGLGNGSSISFGMILGLVVVSFLYFFLRLFCLTLHLEVTIANFCNL